MAKVVYRHDTVLPSTTTPTPTPVPTPTPAPTIIDRYTGPSMAEIMAMQSDGIPRNYAEAMTSLSAWKRAHPGVDPFAPTPTPTPAPPTPPADTGPSFAEKLTSARGRAEQQAELYLRSEGYDPQQFMPMIKQEFDRLQQNILPTDDPSNAFGDNIASSVLNGEIKKQRNNFLGQVNAKFTPGFEDQAVPSSILDDTINSILGTQQNSAMDYLNRGKARGIYNDVGYNAGLGVIGNEASAAKSDLTSLGSSVIDNYRTRADNIRDSASNAASAFDFSGNFSLDPYTAQLGDVTSRATANAGGDLRNLIGGKNYFDLPQLTSAAGTAQGALNLRDTDVATALAERKRQNSLSRGLGSQGAF